MIEIGWLKKWGGAFAGRTRAGLLMLAFAPVLAVLDFAVIASLIYVFSYWGLFLPLARAGAGAEPAAWVLWLSDPAWPQVVTAAVLGVLGGLVFRKWPVFSALALAAGFPGFVSIQFLAVLFLAERLGFRLGETRSAGDGVGARRLALGAAAAGLVATLIFGRWVQMGWMEIVEFESIFHPQTRYLLTGLVMGPGLLLEVGLNLVSFHFYHASRARR